MGVARARRGQSLKSHNWSVFWQVFKKLPLDQYSEMIRIPLINRNWTQSHISEHISQSEMFLPNLLSLFLWSKSDKLQLCRINLPIYLSSPMQTCCLSPLLCLKSVHHARDPFQLKRKKDTGQISSDFFGQHFKYFAIDQNIKVAATTS